MDNQQGQPPRWPLPSEQPPNSYPPNQGWGSPQCPPGGQQPLQGQPRLPYPQHLDQPPPQYYPPPYPQQLPPPPRKKNAVWVVAAVIVGLLFICAAIGQAANHQGSTASTTTPTPDLSSPSGIEQYSLQLAQNSSASGRPGVKEEASQPQTG